MENIQSEIIKPEDMSTPNMEQILSQIEPEMEELEHDCHLSEMDGCDCQEAK